MKKVILSVLAIASLIITSCSDHSSKPGKESTPKLIGFSKANKSQSSSALGSPQVRVGQGIYALRNPVTISTGAIYLWR